MRVAFAVAVKDLRQRIRDRSAIFMAFIAPTLLAAIVTSAFGGGFGQGTANIRMTVAVADEDHSRVSKAFTSVLSSPQLKSLIASVKQERTQADARKTVGAERVDVGFVIPKGFQAAVALGGATNVTVVSRAKDPIFQTIAEAIATSFTEQVAATRLAIFTTASANQNKKVDVAKLTAEATQGRIPLRIRDAGLAKHPVSGANYFGPGMAMFFLFFTVGFGARSLYAEREQGTLQRILAAPAPRSAIVVGKAGAMFVLGVVSMTSVYLAMRFLFGVSWGDPLAVFLLTVLAVLAVMGVSAVVQTLAKTEQQAAAYGSVVGMVFALAGGSFFPLFQMPAVVQKISALTPNGWALRGFTDIAYDGATAAKLIPNFLAMAAFVVVCGTIAVINARRLAPR